VYRHIRVDKNEPFYIGIGTQQKNQPYSRAFQKYYRNKYWNHIVSISDYEVEILYETNDENEISEKEKEFILIYGRKDLNTGSLVNMTDGGELIYNFGPEVLAAKSERMKGNTYMKGKKLSNETRAKMSEVQSKKDYSYLIGLSKMSKEKRNELAIRNIGNKYGLGKLKSNETKFKISEKRKKPIYVCNKQNEILFQYSSVDECAADLKLVPSVISMFISGKRVHKDYSFIPQKNYNATNS